MVVNNSVASQRDAKIGVLEYWSIDFQRLTKVGSRIFADGRWIISPGFPATIAHLTLLPHSITPI